MLDSFLWQKPHLFLVQNQGVLKRLFIGAYSAIFALIGLGFYLFSAQKSIYIFIALLSNKFGLLALGLFIVTLIPGILQRFKLNLFLSMSIVLFRRHIGVLMYLLALLHSMYLSTIPVIMSGKFGIAIPSQHEVYGSLSILILLPVWLTSNDVSQRFLGRFWKTLQRLTYFASIFIFLHVSLINPLASAFLAFTLFFECASWIKVWFFQPVVQPKV